MILIRGSDRNSQLSTMKSIKREIEISIRAERWIPPTMHGEKHREIAAHRATPTIFHTSRKNLVASSPPFERKKIK